LWLNGIISWIFKIPNILTLTYITIPIFVLTSFIGFLSLAEKLIQKKLNFHIIIFCFFLLFISGNYIIGNIFNIRISSYFLTSPLFSFKLSYFYPFVISIVLCFLYEKYLFSIILGLCLILASVAAMPSIIGGGVLVAFCSYKYLKIKKRVLIIFYLLIFCFLYLIIIMIIGFKDDIGAKLKLVEIYNFSYYRLFNLEYLYYIFISIFSGLKQIIFSYIYVIITIVLFMINFKLNINNNFKRLLFLLGSFILSGLLSFSLLNFHPNSLQLFDNISSVSLNIVCVLIFIKIYNSTNKIKYQAALSIIILISFFAQIDIIKDTYFPSKSKNNNKYTMYYAYNPPYSKSYIYKIQKASKEIFNSVGACLTNDSVVYKNESIWQTEFDLFTLGNYFYYYVNLNTKSFSTINLSVYDYKLTTNSMFYLKAMKDSNKLNPFYRFVENQKKNKVFKSISQSKYDFIKKNKIEFLIISEGKQIDNILQKEIRFFILDSITKEKFCILKKY